MIDYGICFRESMLPNRLASISTKWDIFISAYNTSERVVRVFEEVQAQRKIWLVQAEYGFQSGTLPDGAFVTRSRDEALFWRQFDEFAGQGWDTGSICIDITGFMRPQLVFLVLWLLGIKRRPFAALYSDPTHYAKREDTVFSKGPVAAVRQIRGCEGCHSLDTTSDCLVVGMGYDDELVRRVAEWKEDARKIQLYGLPSLEADMYQESVLRCSKAREALGTFGDERCFAPANDPFATACVLQGRVREEGAAARPMTNLYLSPLGTKPQTLGFALFFATELRGTASSIIFPFTEGYEQETSRGLARTWMYDVECLAS